MAERKNKPIEKNEETIEKETNTCDCETMIATSSNFTYGFEESLAMEDVANRNLYINGEIKSDTFQHIYYLITRYNAEDAGIPIEERLPIKLHICTGGGSVWDGLGICEIIQNSTTPVIGICTSYAASMGFFIFISCNLRYATENAFFLNHEGYESDYGHPSKIRDYITFSDKLKDRFNKLITRNTKLTARDLKDDERIENYFFADEAKDMGVVDYIIGQDCTLDEIL